LSDWGHNYCRFGSLWTSDLDPLDCLCYAVTRVPAGIFDSAYRCLFGKDPGGLSYRSLELVGHALFQPPILIKHGRYGQLLSWSEALQQIELAESNAHRCQQDIRDLLHRWGDE
jgi:hypothetical protein